MSHLLEAWGRLVEGELGGWLSTLPIKDDPTLPNEATVRGDGFIRVGPKFHQLTDAGQKNVLWHEAAHFYGLDDLWLEVSADWNLVAKMRYGHLNGETKPGEIVAEAYSVLMTDGPDELDDYSYEGFAAEIIGLAQQKGLPTP